VATDAITSLSFTSTSTPVTTYALSPAFQAGDHTTVFRATAPYAATFVVASITKYAEGTPFDLRIVSNDTTSKGQFCGDGSSKAH
jgi:hypothetical protein